MQMVNLQIMIHVFRNYTYLQLSHFAFENKIPMIVFQDIYTHRSGLKPCLLTFTFWFCVQRELKQKQESGGLSGVCHSLLARLSSHPPSNHKKRSEVSGQHASGNPVFKPLGRKWGRGHIWLKNKIQISSQSEKNCTFSIMKLLYINPNILSLARNIPVQHQNSHQIHLAKNNTFYFLNTPHRTVLRRALRLATTDTQQPRLISSTFTARDLPRVCTRRDDIRTQ